MEFVKLRSDALTREQFAQIVEIEMNCGLEPYSPDMLWMCLAELDTFACLDGGRVVGFLTMQSCGRYFGGCLYIVNLNVAQAYRGRGIAKKLMYTAYSYYIRDHGDKLVSLDVRKTSRAVGLYRKIGFQVADIPSRNGDTDVVMAMPLSKLGENLTKLLEVEKYCEDPCGSASIPYWKAMGISVPENMKILHDREFRSEMLEAYMDTPYFRLRHDLRCLVPATLPQGFSLYDASAEDFAAHINKCYDGIGVTTADLQSYTQRKVFCSELWLAVRDDETGEITATGIAELDQEIGEGVLEWIQVSKEYRGRGLGGYLVRELLWRMRNHAKFATVSGQCDNASNPERLYRSCGFSGNDVWHILCGK